MPTVRWVSLSLFSAVLFAPGLALSQSQQQPQGPTPMLVEWPATERANLEALLRRGPVAVIFSRAGMQPLPGCALPGGYGWRRAPKSERFEIGSPADLQARLPDLVSLEGELTVGGKITVQLETAGQIELQGLQPGDIPQGGDCAQATHVIGGVTLGAFNISRGGTFSVSGRMSSDGISVGGASVREGGVLFAAGDLAACKSATDKGPSPSCSAPIQATLWEIPGRQEALARQATAQAAQAAAPRLPQARPGTVRVDVLSADRHVSWNVFVDGQQACVTPCTWYVDPLDGLFMRSRGEGDEIDLPDLGPNAAGGPMQVVAHPSNGALVTNGIVFTSLGGMAAITGIALTSIGCSIDERGMCNAGLITLGSGALVTGGAIWMLLAGQPRVEIFGGQIQATPNGVGGTF